jgi:hypothetical protein
MRLQGFLVLTNVSPINCPSLLGAALLYVKAVKHVDVCAI